MCHQRQCCLFIFVSLERSVLTMSFVVAVFYVVWSCTIYFLRTKHCKLQAYVIIYVAQATLFVDIDHWINSSFCGSIVCFSVLTVVNIVFFSLVVCFCRWICVFVIVCPVSNFFALNFCSSRSWLCVDVTEGSQLMDFLCIMCSMFAFRLVFLSLVKCSYIFLLTQTHVHTLICSDFDDSQRKCN